MSPGSAGRRSPCSPGSASTTTRGSSAATWPGSPTACSTGWPGPCSSTRPNATTCVDLAQAATSGPAHTSPARPAGPAERAADPRRDLRARRPTCATDVATSSRPTGWAAPCTPSCSTTGRPAGEHRPVRLPRARGHESSSWTGTARPATRSPRCAPRPAKNPYDRSLSDLIGELCTRSEEFSTRWAAHNVRFHRIGLQGRAPPDRRRPALELRGDGTPGRSRAVPDRLQRRAGHPDRRRTDAAGQLGRDARPHEPDRPPSIHQSNRI